MKKKKPFTLPKKLIRGKLTFPGRNVFALIDLTKEEEALQEIRDAIANEEARLKAEAKKKKIKKETK